MSLDAYKYQSGSSKWNTYSAYAAGIAAPLFAIQSGWLQSNLPFGFADNSFIYFMLISIYCKLEARSIESNLLINIGLEQLSNQKDNN